MRIAARVRNAGPDHRATVTTDGSTQELEIPPKTSGPGSGVNGGELLMLALATCYCNDVYREAARLAIPLESVEVEAEADFDGIGLAATNIKYRARIASSAPQSDVEALLRRTDAVAEVHNTLRAGAIVSLEHWHPE